MSKTFVILTIPSISTVSATNLFTDWNYEHAFTRTLHTVAGVYRHVTNSTMGDTKLITSLSWWLNIVSGNVELFSDQNT